MNGTYLGQCDDGWVVRVVLAIGGGRLVGVVVLLVVFAGLALRPRRAQIGEVDLELVAGEAGVEAGLRGGLLGGVVAIFGGHLD